MKLLFLFFLFVETDQIGSHSVQRIPSIGSSIHYRHSRRSSYRSRRSKIVERMRTTTPKTNNPTTIIWPSPRSIHPASSLFICFCWFFVVQSHSDALSLALIPFSFLLLCLPHNFLCSFFYYALALPTTFLLHLRTRYL